LENSTKKKKKKDQNKMAAKKELDLEETKQFVEKKWDESIIPALFKFIEIPNQSPFFDPDWAASGYTDEALELLRKWALELDVAGMQLQVIRHGERTPILFGEISATKGYENLGSVLLYAHADKVSPLTDDWEEGLGPYTPVMRDGKLYGRGGADDGYGMFAALTAIKALQEQGVGHGRCVLLIETCEESGSRDLPHYLAAMSGEIGDPSLVVCLDSGCGNYEQLWLSTTLRGAVAGTLKINILEQGVHSGMGSGIVPSSFRIARILLDRIEDAQTGKVHEAFHTAIPEHRLEQVKQCAELLGDSIKSDFLFVGDAHAVSDDNVELLLNQTWRPQLSYIGVGGIPACADASNVLRAKTELTLSLRLPPNADADEAGQTLKRLLEENPPYGASVEFELSKAGSGFDAPKLAPWLADAINGASQNLFQKPMAFLGCGGSIPFMNQLKTAYPNAQFMIVGVLGPASNAHGPNEFLHIGMGKALTTAISTILSTPNFPTTD
jgi:acetylornithine deacetylase/succinyl-diaminopimelate desuccinylase-like protein